MRRHRPGCDHISVQHEHHARRFLRPRRHLHPGCGAVLARRNCVLSLRAGEYVQRRRVLPHLRWRLRHRRFLLGRFVHQDRAALRRHEHDLRGNDFGGRAMLGRQSPWRRWERCELPRSSPSAGERPDVWRRRRLRSGVRAHNGRGRRMLGAGASQACPQPVVGNRGHRRWCGRMRAHGWRRGRVLGIERWGRLGERYARSLQQHPGPGRRAFLRGLRHRYRRLIVGVRGENDGRVNPAHSRKMIARLQAAAPASPVYLSINSHAGHGIGSALSIRVGQRADVYAFLFDQLGMKPPVN